MTSTALKFSLILFFVCHYHFSQNHSTYFVGHSLIGNTMPDMLDHLATTNQINYTSKRQIINGAPLKYNWENPSSGEMGNYTTDLPTGNYNTLILTEAIPLDNHITWSNTYVMANNFYTYFNTYVNNGTSYIYETWHCINSGTDIDCAYDEGDAVSWRDRLDADLSKWEAIAAAINNQNPEANTTLIPAGQAMALLYDEIALNNVSGISSISDFFTDDIHLNDMGNYYIACVMYTVLFNENPVGLTRDISNIYGVPYQTPNAVLANQLQLLALKSVCNYQNNTTGICQSLSIAETHLNAPLEIVNHTKTIQLKSKRNTVSGFRIYNMLGQEVRSKTNINESKLTVNKPEVAHGMYILIVTLNNGQTINKRILF